MTRLLNTQLVISVFGFEIRLLIYQRGCTCIVICICNLNFALRYIYCTVYIYHVRYVLVYSVAQQLKLLIAA